MEKGEKMGTLRILDKKLGDKQISICKENEEEAKREFSDAIKKGYIAFEINSSGAKQLIKELNVDAEQIIMVPSMIGG